MSPELFYWNREKRGSAAEVDYLVPAASGAVLPVEVKTGKSGTLRSLHVFVQEKNVDVALRFNSDLPSVVDLHAATVVGRPKAVKLISLPLYLVEQWPHLVGCQAGGIADAGGG